MLGQVHRYTPSVWRAGGVTNEALGLERMMTAVLLHEGAHVAQASTYGARMAALVAANNLRTRLNEPRHRMRRVGRLKRRDLFSGELHAECG